MKKKSTNNIEERLDFLSRDPFCNNEAQEGKARRENEEESQAERGRPKGRIADVADLSRREEVWEKSEKQDGLSARTEMGIDSGMPHHRNGSGRSDEAKKEYVVQSS